MPPREFSPNPILSNVVQHYWYIERQFTPPHNTFEILPDTHIELIFNFGAPCYTTVNNELQPLTSCFVVGLLDETIRIQANGLVKFVCVRLYPWGFYELFGELIRQPALGLMIKEFLFDTQAVRIQKQLALSIDAAIDELQRFLIANVLTLNFQEPELIQAAQDILAQKGNLSLEELASKTHVSIRTLRRKFTYTLGLAPKSFARTARFEAVRDALWQNPNADLAEIALNTGYADQAHMQREFRQFSARTPRQFAAEMRLVRQTMDHQIGRNIQ